MCLPEVQPSSPAAAGLDYQKLLVMVMHIEWLQLQSCLLVSTVQHLCLPVFQALATMMLGHI